MITRFVVISLLLTIASTIQAQGLLKKIKNKTEQAIGNAAGNQIEKKVNQTADKAFEKKDKQKKSSNGADSTATTVAAGETESQRIKAYSKYDFVPGKDLLLADDFSQDEIGEFPGKWNTNGKGEIVTFENDEKHWLKMAQESVYFTPNTKQLPESFTIEFDMILDMHNKGWSYPEFRFTLFNSGDVPPTDKSLFTKMKAGSAAMIILQPGEFNNTGTIYSTYAEERETFKTPFKGVKLVEEQYRKSMHFAISVHKERFRFWINEQKIYDLPKGVSSSFNQFAISVSSSNYKEDDLSFYFSDFKLAGGLPDTKTKLLKEGKLVSHGICFDVNSDRIKPSSFGAIKEIGELMRANPSLKFRIIGHTDSDGDAEFNKSLSLKRATAVKNFLMDQYGIDASRLEKVEGKGEEEPIAGNETTLGKAQNRRVEFLSY